MAQQRRPASRRHQHRQQGTALVEFALVAPILLVLLFGTIEFGRVLNTMVLVTNAAREGARRGAVGENDGQIRTTVQNYLQASGLQTSQLATQITLSTVAGTPQVDVSLTYSLDLLLPTLHLVPDPLPVTGTTVMRVE